MRLDKAVVARGLARSRTAARQAILAGDVQVDGVVVTRPAYEVGEHSVLVAAPAPYVSRAAYKLLGALDDLGLSVAGRALNAGSSTGGFTQVLLERGCHEVVAVDVGTDQLHHSLRHDPRVRVHERTSLRDLDLELIAGPVDLVVADVSFISLRLLLAPITAVLRPGGRLLTMVKPQFEVGRGQLGVGGVVRDHRLRQQAVVDVATAARALGWQPRRAAVSRLPGPAGNREYFVCFERGQPARALDLSTVDLDARPAFAAGTRAAAQP